MPAQANANVVALQLEKVRDKVPLLYERDDILLTMIQQRGDVEKISSRNMRLPLQVNPGGKAGSYIADGGDLGSVAGTTLTMSVPSGAALVYVGQTIQVYDTTLTTNRGTCNVTAADPISPTQTITVDVLPGGTVATDVIVHDGLSGAQPVSLFGV